MTWQERFWSKVSRDESCWPWTASTNDKGYGNAVKAGESRSAHIVAYELLVGPVPKGRELDHICRNRTCVNPAHLEPVTHRENLMRGDTLVAANVAKTHCLRGHEFTAANTLVYRGHRHCRQCKLIRNREWRARKGSHG